MKKTALTASLFASLILPAIAMAAPLEGLKFEQQKQQIVKDVRKNCPACVPEKWKVSAPSNANGSPGVAS